MFRLKEKATGGDLRGNSERLNLRSLPEDQQQFFAEAEHEQQYCKA
jgi:hypothetical protein